ncbi:uncharacterized protein LOC141904089 [Tubulanus polymorphus]|uniref:uncharacterized protein LOC141904089 n=1 Tax=Tubulanus polymorphus TaxID=672921 RepID=UPI003DA4D89F
MFYSSLRLVPKEPPAPARLPKYVSTAYVYRINDDQLKQITGNTTAAEIKSPLLFVHERSPPPQPPQSTDVNATTENTMVVVNKSDVGSSPGHSVDTSVIETVECDEECVEYTSTTVEETSKYVITGVVDPRNQEKISIQEAIAAGIINQGKGVYVDPKTTETIPIPEAMSQGLIIAEMVDTKVGKEHTEKTRVYRTRITENMSYRITGVIDPRTRREVPVSHAVNIGLLDEDNALYIHPITGEKLSIQKAVDRGLLLVVDVMGPDHIPLSDDESMRVDYVLDPTTGAELSLEDSIEIGVVDVERGSYFKEGEEININDAIAAGYIRATISGDCERTERTTKGPARGRVKRLGKYVLPADDNRSSRKDVTSPTLKFQAKMHARALKANLYLNISSEDDYNALLQGDWQESKSPLYSQSPSYLQRENQSQFFPTSRSGDQSPSSISNAKLRFDNTSPTTEPTENTSRKCEQIMNSDREDHWINYDPRLYPKVSYSLQSKQTPRPVDNVWKQPKSIDGVNEEEKTESISSGYFQPDEVDSAADPRDKPIDAVDCSQLSKPGTGPHSLNNLPANEAARQMENAEMVQRWPSRDNRSQRYEPTNDAYNAVTVEEPVVTRDDVYADSYATTNDEDSPASVDDSDHIVCTREHHLSKFFTEVDCEILDAGPVFADNNNEEAPRNDIYPAEDSSEASPAERTDPATRLVDEPRYLLYSDNADIEKLSPTLVEGKLIGVDSGASYDLHDSENVNRASEQSLEELDADLEFKSPLGVRRPAYELYQPESESIQSKEKPKPIRKLENIEEDRKSKTCPNAMYDDSIPQRSPPGSPGDVNVDLTRSPLYVKKIHNLEQREELVSSSSSSSENEDEDRAGRKISHTRNEEFSLPLEETDDTLAEHQDESICSQFTINRTKVGLKEKVIKSQDVIGVLGKTVPAKADISSHDVDRLYPESKFRPTHFGESHSLDKPMEETADETDDDDDDLDNEQATDDDEEVKERYESSTQYFTLPGDRLHSDTVPVDFVEDLKQSESDVIEDDIDKTYPLDDEQAMDDDVEVKERYESSTQYFSPPGDRLNSDTVPVDFVEDLVQPESDVIEDDINQTYSSDDEKFESGETTKSTNDEVREIHTLSTQYFEATGDKPEDVGPVSWSEPVTSDIESELTEDQVYKSSPSHDQSDSVDNFHINEVNANIQNREPLLDYYNDIGNEAPNANYGQDFSEQYRHATAAKPYQLSVDNNNLIEPESGQLTVERDSPDSGVPKDIDEISYQPSDRKYTALKLRHSLEELEKSESTSDEDRKGCQSPDSLEDTRSEDSSVFNKDRKDSLGHDGDRESMDTDRTPVYSDNDEDEEGKICLDQGIAVGTTLPCKSCYDDLNEMASSENVEQMVFAENIVASQIAVSLSSVGEKENDLTHDSDHVKPYVNELTELNNIRQSSDALAATVRLVSTDGLSQQSDTVQTIDSTSYTYTAEELEFLVSLDLGEEVTMSRRSVSDSGSKRTVSAAERFYLRLYHAVKSLKPTIRCPNGGRDLYFNEAVAQGVLKLDPLEYRTTSGDVYGIQEAAAIGCVDADLVKRLLLVYENHSLQKVLDEEREQLLPGDEDGVSNGELVAQALDCGGVDRKITFYNDYPSCRIKSINNVCDKMDRRQLRFPADKNGQTLDLDEALHKNLLNPDINTKDICLQIGALKFLRQHLDLNQQFSADQNISIKAAVFSSVLNVGACEYNNFQPDDVVRMPMHLASAVKIGYVTDKTGIKIAGAMSKASLGVYIKDGWIDPKLGDYRDKHTGKTLPIDKAVELGLLDVFCVFFIDNRRNKTTSLGVHEESGLFDSKTGKITDPKTNKEYSIQEAISKNIIDAALNPDKILELAVADEHIEKSNLISPVCSDPSSDKVKLLKALQSASTIGELLDQGEIQDDTRYQPKCRKECISLNEALDKTVLNPQCRAVLDPVTGTLVLANGDVLAEALIDANRSLDWVTSVEAALATQEAPVCKTLETLNSEIASHKQLMESNVTEQDAVAMRIRKCLEVLDSLKDTEKDAGQTEQYESLEALTDQLKDRFDRICAEFKQRLTRLHSLGYQFEDFVNAYDSLKNSLDENEAKFDEIRDDFVENSNVEETNKKLQELENQLEAFKCKLASLSASKWNLDDTTGSSIDKDIEDIAEMHQDLLHKCNTLTKTVDEYVEFTNLVREVKPMIDALEKQFEHLAENYAPTDDIEIVKNEQNEALDVAKNIEEMRPRLDDVVGSGGNLVGKLKHVGSDDGGDLLNATVQTIEECTEKFNKIQSDLETKKKDIDEDLKLALVVTESLDKLVEWADYCQEKLLENEMPSMLLDKLEVQAEQAKQLQGDVIMQTEELDRIRKISKGSENVNNILDALEERLKEIDPKATTHVDNIDTTLEGVKRLEELAHEVKDLLDDITNRCTNQEFANLPENAAEQLGTEKSAKESVMDELKTLGEQLLSGDKARDKDKLKEQLANLQSDWHDVDDLLASKTADESNVLLDAHMKDLADLEAELNNDEPGADLEAIKNLLADNKALEEKLAEKQLHIKDLQDKCNKALRLTTDDAQGDLRFKLDSAKKTADRLSKDCSNQRDRLENMLPLVTHYGQTHDDVVNWLDEIEADVYSQSQESPGDNPDQVKKQKENAVESQQSIDDHKPQLEDLNATAKELVEICPEEDAAVIGEELNQVNKRFDNVSSACSKRLDILDGALKAVSSELIDKVEDALNTLLGLQDALQSVDPVAAKPVQLKKQLDDLQDIFRCLERTKPFVEQLQNISQKPTEDGQLEDDTKEKITDLLNAYNDVNTLVTGRSGAIRNALPIADDFWNTYKTLDNTLRELQDNIASLDAESIDPEFIKEQQNDMKGIEDEFNKATDDVKECSQLGDKLTAACGPPAKMEVKKHMDDLDDLCNDIEDDMKDKNEELDIAMEKANKLQSLMEGIMSWLPPAIDTVMNMPPVAVDARSIRIQIEQLKVLKVQVHPKSTDIESLAQQAKEIIKAAPSTTKRLEPMIAEVNEKWEELLAKIADRENELNQGLIQVGEIDSAMDDMIGMLQDAEDRLSQLNQVYGDPKCVEIHLKNLMHMKAAIRNHEPTIKQLAKTVDKMTSDHNAPSKLKTKKDEMNSLLASIYLDIKDKQNKLQDTLKQVKLFSGEVDDNLQFVNDFRAELRHAAPMGAIPYSAKKNLDRFMAKYVELEKRDGDIEMLLFNGEDILSRCTEADAAQLSDNLLKLKQRWNSTKRRAAKKLHKLEGHLEKVKGFHVTVQICMDWLITAEDKLKEFRYPSKVVERIDKQIEDHKEFLAEIEDERKILEEIDNNGTYLKYFGNKEDSLYVKRQLQDLKLRFKKLKRRAEERGRLLNQARKEDLRFYTSWKDLTNWCDEYKAKISDVAKSKSPTDITSDVDEMRRFNHQIHAKYPAYHTTLRLGKNLKDRCTKADPDRETLQTMIDELKRKWTLLRNVASERQTTLDGVLLSTGLYSDAVQSTIEWLTKTEEQFKDSQPVLGDLDTIEILLEQHKTFQDDLDSHQASMDDLIKRASGDGQLADKLDILQSKWTNVNELSKKKEKELQSALTTAETFHNNVQTMLDWLPNAESELKFRPLPDEEDDIVKLIEKHAKFQEDSNKKDKVMENISRLGRTILENCHPSAKKFVKYYITVTKTRWDQVKSRTKNRTQRLHDALRAIQGNAAIVEDLLQWLADSHNVIVNREKATSLNSLEKVEMLVREHMDFHEELTNKGKETDRVTKLPHKPKTSRMRRANTRRRGDPVDAIYNTRLATLNARWRSLWRISVDRKKKLQDALDHLLELESFKNFNFEDWRQRYLAWIKEKKFRLTDVFRKQARSEQGTLSREEFIEGMMNSKFHTNRTELRAVFDIFDRDKSGEIDYREFMDALRPDRFQSKRYRPVGGAKSRMKRQVTESEMVQDEIEREVAKCTCCRQFPMERIAEGKYRFGDHRKMFLVRFLNSCVMVRVGGGWERLDRFLMTHDPCRAKGKTNTELHESFTLPEGAAQTRAGFVSKRSASKPSPRPSPGGSPLGSPALQRKSRASPLTSSNTETGCYSQMIDSAFVCVCQPRTVADDDEFMRRRSHDSVAIQRASSARLSAGIGTGRRVSDTGATGTSRPASGRKVSCPPPRTQNCGAKPTGTSGLSRTRRISSSSSTTSADDPFEEKRSSKPSNGLIY